MIDQVIETVAEKTPEVNSEKAIEVEPYENIQSFPSALVAL